MSPEGVDGFHVQRGAPEDKGDEYGKTSGGAPARGWDTHFLAGAVFCRFHIFSVWSSEAVTSTGSTGWKVSARMPSKWLRSVNLGFHVFLIASLLFPIWRRSFQITFHCFIINQALTRLQNNLNHNHPKHLSLFHHTRPS